MCSCLDLQGGICCSVEFLAYWFFWAEFLLIDLLDFNGFFRLISLVQEIKKHEKCIQTCGLINQYNL